MTENTLIKQRNKILEARRQMLTRFLRGAECVETNVGFKGASSSQIVFWRKDLRLWVSFNWAGKPDHKRYWIGWGVDSPKSGSVNIVCETNMAVEGYNPRLGSAFIRAYGHTYLIHHGNIGGGRSGIGKSFFWKHFQGNITELETGKEVAVIGRVANEGSLDDLIRDFVYEVARIKRLAKGRKV